MTDALVHIENLNVSYRGPGRSAHILDGVDITIGRGQSVGLVGESGSGKSTVAFTLLGLLADNAEISANRAAFDGCETDLASGETTRLRGTDIAMVFQDPMTALNPMFTIGTQLVDIQRKAGARSGRGRKRCSPMWACRMRRGACTSIRTNSPAACDSALSSPWRFWSNRSC